MRKLLIFLALLMLVSGAMAQGTWYPRSGDYNTTGDVNADNAAFSGDVNVVGALTTGVGPIADGVYDSDLRLAANHSFYSTTGSGGIDWSNGTGPWKMPTGAGTVAGTTDFNGAITARNITLDANYNIVTSGTGTITSAATITGEQLTSTDDAFVNDDLTVDGGARIDETATVNALVSNTTIVGEDIESSDDGYITDDFIIDGGLRVDETATINALVINSTADINGATTTAAITVDSGSIITADQYKRRAVTTATNYTISDGGADVYLVGNSTDPNSQTITFPTAADNAGRVITVILATDPGTNTVILDGEGSEEIDGSTTKTTTDAVGSMYHLICNGVAWIKLASDGTWS